MSRFRKSDDRSKHQYYEDRLSAYLDGELAPQEQDAVERHLATCQACKWDLDTLRATVQWTSELPTVPLPRVFTIPAPAQPERVVQRRWSFVPVLQGATALVALLLFFAVAGDFLRNGFIGGRVSEPMLVQEQAPLAVEITRVVEVEKEVEAPAAAEPEAEVVVERAAVETVVVEKAVTEQIVVVTVQVEKEVAVPAPTPMPQATAAAQPPPGETGATAPKEASVAAETPVLEGGIGGEVPEEPPAEAATVAAEAADAAAGGGPTPTMLASPQALALGASAEPTTIAEEVAPAPAMPETDEGLAARTWRRPAIDWLRVIEIALALTFLLLVAATIFATIQKRRAR
jgi:anti-sigma factor RsiW